jgi:hypothetical protein
MMNKKLVLLGSSTIIFLMLVTYSEWTLNVNAQGNSGISDLQSAGIEADLSNLVNKTTIEISSIITPWNTGNK